MVPIVALNLGTFIMTLAYVVLSIAYRKLTSRVAGTGFNCPKASFSTMMELIQFNLRRIPFFKAWGAFAFMGDMTILIASESFPTSNIGCADGSDLLLVQSQGQYASSSTKVARETTDDRP